MWADAEWSALVRDLQQFDDVDVAVDAATRLHNASTTEDVPRLAMLLEDDSFFVREAAAWPLAALGQVALLPDLFRAFQRSLDDGHDNDGFTAARWDLVEFKKDEMRALLNELVISGDASIRESAEWLLEFCEPA